MGEAVLFSTDKETAYLLKVAYICIFVALVWLLENYYVHTTTTYIFSALHIIETWNWIPYWFPDKCLSTYLPVILTTFKKRWWLVRSSCTLKFQNLKFFQKEFFKKNIFWSMTYFFWRKKKWEIWFSKNLTITKTFMI